MTRMRTQPRPWDPSYFTTRANLAVLRRAIRAAGQRPRVVDVGCGAKPFAALLPAGAEHLGVDFDARTAADLVHDLNEALPLPSESAELVILSETLEHVHEPELVLAEAARLLVPGGQLFLSAPFAFPIHGRPFDYRRFTDYYYRRVGECHPLELVELEASNNVVSTPLLLVAQILQSAPLLPWWAKRPGWLALNGLAVVLELAGRRWWRSEGRIGLFLRMNPCGYAMRFRRRPG